MKLLPLAITIAFQAIATSAIDTILFKQHGSIEYSDGILSNDIIEQLKHSISLSEQQQSHRGQIMVDNNIFQRIKDAAGSAIDLDDIIDANTGGVKLQTRFIDQSTQPHVDRYHHNGKVVVDDVMFVALDSNPDAYFTHGDSSIPAVAGRLFRFNGSIKHGTTFNGGNPIRLLGPFSTKNFASVGIGCPANGLCIDGANMIIGVGVNCGGGQDDECYEPFDDSTVGCPSNGVCVTVDGEMSVFDGIGDGNLCSSSNSNSDCFVCTSCSTEVFVTSETYQGDLGGISGADAKCQERACSAGLVGNYKAWLSDETSNPANDFVQSGSAYLVVVNVPVATKIADDFADLTDGVLDSDRSINRDENGNTISGNLNVWTNTNADGTKVSNDRGCEDWSSDGGGSIGQVGDASASDSEWTRAGPDTTQTCDNFARLYCFTQGFTDVCPASTSTMATTTAAATTQVTTTAATTPETTSQTSTTMATTQATTTTTTTPTPSVFDLLLAFLSDLELPSQVALLIALIIILVIFGHLDGIELGAMLEGIQAEGGIRGHGRTLENKEDLKALLISLLEEKLDLDEY